MIVLAIEKNKSLLNNLSNDRKKYELDHIFLSNNVEYGIKLLKNFELLKVLDIEKINRVKDYTDLIGIWAMIDSNSYNFNNSEKELIKNINVVYDLNNLDKHVLYKYGLYVNVLAGLNKDLSKKKIIEIYQNLPIQSRDDIEIKALKICDILKIKPNYLINDIYNELEYQIIEGNLVNKEKEITNYITNKYKKLVDSAN